MEGWHLVCEGGAYSLYQYCAQMDLCESSLGY
jgi:hypothetical protein